jgi:hypothetical protein
MYLPRVARPRAITRWRTIQRQYSCVEAILEIDLQIVARYACDGQRFLSQDMRVASSLLIDENLLPLQPRTIFDMAREGDVRYVADGIKGQSEEPIDEDFLTRDPFGSPKGGWLNA